MASSPVNRRVMLPGPAPYQGPDRCPSCVGAKLTGARYVFDPSAGASEQVLLADVFCPNCGGCGRATHDSCEPKDHADWDPADLDEEDYYETACPSCYGRRWWVCQAFNQTTVYNMRVACGCATDLLIPADDQP